MTDAVEAALYLVGLMVGLVLLLAGWKGHLREGAAAVGIVVGYAVAFVAVFLAAKGQFRLSDAGAFALTMLLFALAMAFKFGHAR